MEIPENPFVAYDDGNVSDEHESEISYRCRPFHSVLTISNIKNSILAILDQDKTPYLTLATLFTNHAYSYEVLDHIDITEPKPADIDMAL